MPSQIDHGTKTIPATVRAQARYFRALGDPTRLRILSALLQKDATVGELVKLTGVSQSKISNHLACLRWCRFVESERVGRTLHYRLTDFSVESVLSVFKSLPRARIEQLAGRERGGPDWIY